MQRYLIGALSDCVDELLDDQVDAFQTGLFQFNDLLFHYGLKRHVWGEQACPEGHTDTQDRRRDEDSRGRGLEKGGR